MSKVLTVRLDEKLFKKIDTVAKNMDRSKSWIVKKLLNSYLEDLYDLEEAKRILLDKSDEIIDHDKAKEEIPSD